MMSDRERAQAAEAFFKKTTISYPAFVERCKDPNYPKETTNWAKGFALLDTIGVQAPPPPAVDLSLVQNVLILADDPWPALQAPPHYKFWITADLGYRHIYADGSFINAARAQRRRVESWCDCKAVLGTGTPPEVAIQMAHDYKLDGACGEGEHSAAFQSGWDAGMRRFVVNLSALTGAQKSLIGSAAALVTAEMYLNKQPGFVVNWENLNAGIGSNCGATYESKDEGAVATPIGAYEHYPNSVYPKMSWYCGGSPKPDFARLP